MRDLFVFSDSNVKNYLDDSDFYSYMNIDEILDYKLKVKLKGYNFTGKFVYTNYFYWLAKNKNYNINLTTNIDCIPSNSIVFFHHDNYFNLKYRSDLIYVQMLSDKPLIPFADFYISNSKSFCNSKKFNNVLYLPEPLPAKNLDFIPNRDIRTPKNFRFLGIRNNFPECLTHEICEALKKDGINIIKDFSKNYLDNTDDVFFFIRKNINPMSSCKHSNRIFLSYITEIPFLGSISEDDKTFIKDINSFIPILDEKEELINSFYKIKNDETFLQIKHKLSQIDKTFYKNYFFDELDKLINYFQKL